MSFRLYNEEFKTLIDDITGLSSWAVYIPPTSQFPAVAFIQESLTRDVESSINYTSVSAHVFTITVASKTFQETQTITQDLIDTLDQYAGGEFLLTIVEDISEEYDHEFEVYLKYLTVSARVRENNTIANI